MYHIIKLDIWFQALHLPIIIGRFVLVIGKFRLV